MNVIFPKSTLCIPIHAINSVELVTFGNGTAELEIRVQPDRLHVIKFEDYDMGKNHYDYVTQKMVGHIEK